MMAMQAEKLAQWIHAFRFDEAGPRGPRSSNQPQRVEDYLLDLLGVMLAGVAREDSAKAALADAREQGGRGDATLLIPRSPLVPAESAAFAHAVAAHSIEMDDVHNGSSLHPGVVVIPPALALAEERGRTGHELLDAIVIGYEIAIRIGEVGHPTRIYAQGFHPTPVCGVFGSAAASARLMGLGIRQTVNALGLAWSFAAGSMSFQAEGSWAKRMQVGHAARCGVQAARLAERGATGPAHALEPHGFFRSYAGAELSDAEVNLLSENLGRDLRIFATGIKPHACCRYNQTPIDCLLELRANNSLQPADVEEIEIEIASTGLPLVARPLERKQRPANPVEAQFSLPYSAAVALTAGEAGPDQYLEPWLTREDVLALGRRVKVGSSPEIGAKFPHKWPARVSIRLKNGRRLEAASDDCLGDPAKPLSRTQLEAKFNRLTQGVLHDDTRLEALSMVRNLPDLQRSADLMQRIAAGLTTA